MFFSFTRWMRKSFNKSAKAPLRNAARRLLTCEYLESRFTPAFLTVTGATYTISYEYTIDRYFTFGASDSQHVGPTTVTSSNSNSLGIGEAGTGIGTAAQPAYWFADWPNTAYAGTSINIANFGNGDRLRIETTAAMYADASTTFRIDPSPGEQNGNFVYVGLSVELSGNGTATTSLGGAGNYWAQIGNEISINLQSSSQGGGIAYNLNYYPSPPSNGFSTSSTATVRLSFPPPPPFVSTPDLDNSSDSGQSNSDNLTNNLTSQKLVGIGNPGNSIGLYEGGTLIGTTGAGSDRQWSCTVALPEGTHQIYAIASNGTETYKSGSMSYIVDHTAPLITQTHGSPNENNWFKNDVTVSFAASDAYGIDSVTGPVTLGEGANQSVVGTAVDLAGNSASLPVSGINIDKTPPQVVGIPDRQPNQFGWYNNDVIVTFVAVDNLSGVDVVTAPYTLTAEAANQIAQGNATDRAGNTASGSSPLINIDKTAPQMTYYRTPATGFDNGGKAWNNNNVVVEFFASDVVSGVQFVSGPVVLTMEKAGQSASGLAIDLAGNSATLSVNDINIDLTPPTITAKRSPLPNAFGWNNTSVTVTFAGGDNLSGLASITNPVVLSINGANQQALGKVTDNAGNVATLVVNNINIDTIPPDLIGNWSPSPFPFVGDKVVCAVNAIDATSGVASIYWRLYLNDVLIDGAVGVAIRFIPQTPGVYVARCFAKDRADNQNILSIPITVYPKRVIIQGGSGPDTITLAPAIGGIVVTVNGKTTTEDTLNFECLGNGGDDQIVIVGNLGINVLISGGDGDDTLIGGSGSINVLLGGNGNDTLKGGNGNDWMQGGAGDDWLDGMAGNDILLGEAGGDQLLGGVDRDIVIGGDGADRIEGNGGEDILIAGTTTYDQNPSALLALLAEWKSSDSNAARIAHIQSGTGLTQGFHLNGDDGATQTVFNDKWIDVLTGGAGNDWFFANQNGGILDTVTDMKANELWSDTDF